MAPRNSGRIATFSVMAAGALALALIPKPQPPAPSAPSADKRDAGEKTASSAAEKSSPAPTALAVVSDPEAPRPLLRTNTLPIAEVPPVGQTAASAASAASAPASARQTFPGASAQSSAHWSAPQAAPSPQNSPESSAPSAEPAVSAIKTPASSAPAPRVRSVAPNAAGAGKDSPKSRLAEDVAAAGVSSDSKLLAKTSGLVTQARSLKLSGDSGGNIDLSNPQSLRKAVAQQMAQENAADASLRSRLDKLGPDADIETQRQAAKESLAAQNLPTDEISVSNALGRATSPQPAQPPPAAMDASIDKVAAGYTAGPRGPEAKVGPAYTPPGAPPKSGMDAYGKYKAAFDEAKQKFGVEPWDILAIIQQESGFGVNMGQTPEPKAVQNRRSDLAAVVTLDAQHRFPAPWQNLRGSPTGALGPGQFQPATLLWMGKGSPFDWNTLISHNIPKLLKINAYPNRANAFGRYYGDTSHPYAGQVIKKAEAFKAEILRQQADGKTN